MNTGNRSRKAILQYKLLQWMATNPLSNKLLLKRNEHGGVVDILGFNQVKEALREYKALVVAGHAKIAEPSGWVEITPAGIEAAKTAKKPVWVPPMPRPLRADDRRLLLQYKDGKWKTPMRVGGSSGSDVSDRLTILTHHGYLSVKQRGTRGDGLTGQESVPEPRLFTRTRGSRTFRITDLGLQTIANVTQEQWEKEYVGKNS